MNHQPSNNFYKYLRILALLIFITILLHIIGQVILLIIGGTDNRVVNDIINRFGLDEELSFPTWVNSMLALIMAGLAWIVGLTYTRRAKKFAWYVIGCIGLLISIDEVSALHELLLQALHILANFGEGQGFFANAWLLVMPLLFAGLLFFIKLISDQLPKDTFKNMATAITVYLVGAFVVEYLSIPFDKSLAIYNLGVVVLEESLELIGVWLAIKAIFIHIDKHEPELDKKLSSII